LRFSIIDEDPEFRRALRYHIEAEWPDASIREHQPNAEAWPGAAVDGVDLTGVDLIFLGHPIGRENAFEYLSAFRRRADCPPVILFAKQSDEFFAVDALKAGAADFFPKARVKHRRLIESVRCEVSAARADSTDVVLIAGQRLNGANKQRFLAKLYSGDLSSVYLAESADGARRMAYKVVRYVPDAGGGSLFDRFLQEYEVIAKVDHPSVVRIFDLGIADDHAFIVMEFLDAGSLAQRLNGPLDAALAIDYARQISGALSAIHDAGILHRDLKPGNIMFRSDGTLALIDFGLAKQMRLHAAITGTGQIFGTPYYMSPEQGHAEATDPRSDIYGLGCIFYEMLTGDRPFSASSPMGVIYRHAHAPRPRLPAPLERLQPLLDRMLAIKPDDRYQSARAMLHDLEQALP
jgi:DNA-binding NarL/FixJ family response regulator